MTRHFLHELAAIKKMVLYLGSMVEEKVHQIARIIEYNDSELAEEIIRTDYKIDDTLMEQALINLIDNAVKYSGNDCPVHIEAATGKEAVTIGIRDHGPGISKKDIPHLFERFYRIDKARSRDMGGTGLGLSIVKHIVNAHGGRITVDSTPGEGSTFTIHLPRKLIED